MANGKAAKSKGPINGDGARNGRAPGNGARAAEGAGDALERLARNMAITAGRPGAFLLAVAIVIAWLISGPIFGYSNTWQLVINTFTTIVTFLMVFLIQRAQNRDTMALQAKLGELVIAMRGAKNEVAVAEDFSEHELQALHDLHSEEAQQRLDRLEDKVADIRAGKTKASSGK